MKVRSDISLNIVKSYIEGKIPSSSYDIGAIDQMKLMASELKVLQDVFYLLRYQLQESDRALNDLQSQLEVNKALQAEAINKYKEQETEVLKLREQVKHLEATLTNKEQEVFGLKEIVLQRESSVSWRLSQIYGKYVSNNSVFTRLLRGMFNKVMPASRPSDNITTENSVKTESANVLAASPITLFNPYKRLKLIKPIKVTVIDTDYNDKIYDINIKFSLVIPVKNEEGSLQRLIKNIEDQTLKPDEVVFVDGGSTDKTLQILENYRNAGQMPFDIINCQAEWRSLAAQRNDGIRAVRNDILVLTDAGSIRRTIALIW